MVEAASLRRIALPLTGLLTLAGAVGLYIGLRAIPPSDTEIITAVASDYVAETGGSLTDCHAEPSNLPGVRMVVVCRPEAGALRLYPLDDWGVMVDASDPNTSEEPQT